MNLSFEVLLVFGVLGFYLYDSAILLFSNEIIFIESYGKWSVSFPSARWRLMGKLLFFPNPFTPFNLVFLTTWTTKDSSSNNKLKDVSKLLVAMSYLRISVIVLMFLLIIALPIVIFKLGIGTSSLVVLFLIYLTIISMLCYTYFKKEDLGLSNKAFAELAFEALACPPFALNLIRNISLRHLLCKNPVKFAAKRLENEDFKKFIEMLDDKLTEKLELEDEENSPRSIELIKYREKIKGMAL
jgi:hypothetical protein